MASDVSEELRAEVARRAGQRCEYCLLHEDDAGFPHQVDHIISRKHGGSSTSENLAYACRHKGSDVASIDPRTGEIVRLFNPRSDRWAEHFQIEGAVIERFPVSVRERRGCFDSTLRNESPSADSCKAWAATLSDKFLAVLH